MASPLGEIPPMFVPPPAPRNKPAVADAGAVTGRLSSWGEVSKENWSTGRHKNPGKIKKEFSGESGEAEGEKAQSEAPNAPLAGHGRA